MNENDRPQGIGGWLALLVVGMLVLGPLLSVSQTAVGFASAERQYPDLAQVAEWSSYKAVEWGVLLIFSAISIYGGLGLAIKRTPDAVSRAKLVLWFNYPISIVVTAMIIPAMMFPDGAKETAMALPSLLASLIAVVIWTIYLNRSKRVKNTYGLMDDSQAALSPPTSLQTQYTDNAQYQFHPEQTVSNIHWPPPTNEPSNMAVPATSLQANIDEDRIYSKIAEELTGNVDQGVWTRAFAQAGGDEKQTKVIYIKERAARLIAAEHARQEQAAREQAAKTENARLQHQAEEQRIQQSQAKAMKIRNLAQQHSDNPRLTIDEKAELLNLVGGSFIWLDGWGRCSATYNGEERQFSSGKEFANWFSSELVPRLLFIAKHDEEDRIKGMSPLEKIEAGLLSGEIANLSESSEGVRFLNACCWGQREIVEESLKNNRLFIAVSDSAGDTPLHLSVRENQREIAKLLIDTGASPTAENAAGKSTVDVGLALEKWWFFDLIPEETLMREYGVVRDDGKYFSKKSLFSGHFRATRDQDGLTPLLRAIKENKTDQVKKLLRAGHDCNQGCLDGTSVLDYAKKYGNMETNLIFE